MIHCRFSFKMAGNGQVPNVYYPPKEDPDVILVKKGLVSVLSANFKKEKEKVWLKWKYSFVEITSIIILLLLFICLVICLLLVLLLLLLFSIMSSSTFLYFTSNEEGWLVPFKVFFLTL